MNCSEVFNLFDIDPFVLRLSNPTEYWYDNDGCDPCQPPSESPLGGGEDDPYKFAASLAEVLSPAGLSFFADAAEELAESLEDEARAAYWAAVAEVLQ